jgi:uncharacterized protein (UPF0305 family)
VEVSNSSLRNRLKHSGKVELVDVVNERNFYTRHGQHLNSRCKESMANKIAETIENITKKKVDPISMKWYNDEVIIRNTNT